MFTSNVSGRKQSVKINKTYSDEMDIKCGVPC